MTSLPTILDCAGASLHEGALVNDGGDDRGEVVRFIEPDESHWLVEVRWPDGPDDIMETYPALPPEWEGEPLCAVELELVKEVTDGD